MFSILDSKRSRLSVDPFTQETLNLTAISSTKTSETDLSLPPSYDDVVRDTITSTCASPTGFLPTTQLQVETTGVGSCSSVTCSTFNPIYIFRATPDVSPFVADHETPEYVSLRHTPSSGSCILARASDPDRTPLISTTYRWGPGRPPKMRIHHRCPPFSDADADQQWLPEEEEFEIRSPRFISRSQRMVTPYGTFEWRYGSRTERQEARNAHSLLILEKIERVALAGGKPDEKRTRVAQLVRNDEFRTRGSTKYSYGNGGRLMVNLQPWTEEKTGSMEGVEAFVVASCLCMLKKEVDNRTD